jgi:hypothetical protein
MLPTSLNILVGLTIALEGYLSPFSKNERITTFSDDLQQNISNLVNENSFHCKSFNKRILLSSKVKNHLWRKMQKSGNRTELHKDYAFHRNAFCVSKKSKLRRN